MCVGLKFAMGEAVGGAVKSVEKAVRAELRRLEIDASESVLAATLVDLAQRLDAEPGDRAAAMLSSEMRRLLAELKQTGEVNHDLEQFLSGISNPAFRAPGD
jgi:uncharacterized protein (DUF2267 family)